MRTQTQKPGAAMGPQLVLAGAGASTVSTQGAVDDSAAVGVHDPLARSSSSPLPPNTGTLQSVWKFSQTML